MHAWIALALMTPFVQQPDAETRIVEYLRDSVEQGRRVEPSQLVNEVFTSPEDRAAVGRLYDTFFKVPMFLIQYQSSSGEIPTLREIADQFAFNGPQCPARARSSAIRTGDRTKHNRMGRSIDARVRDRDFRRTTVRFR